MKDYAIRNCNSPQMLSLPEVSEKVDLLVITCSLGNITELAYPHDVHTLSQQDFLCWNLRRNLVYIGLYITPPPNNYWGVAVVEWLCSRPLDCEVRGSNPAQGRNLKTKISASGAGEGVSPVQGEAN